MRMFDIINKKKNGEKLCDSEIKFFVDGITNGEIPDYQTSALLMAICIRGMDVEETASLTNHMAKSGNMLDLTKFGNLSCDKHSTGGIGDKTTLIVAPIVASCGCTVAKMSGRGLGYTGGTVDKLEAIPGFSCNMSKEAFISQAEKINLSLASQGTSLAPADKVMYALRDVTATVDSIPLIASSIMSKKIASGAHSIVLDVKCGKGAFMESEEDAESLARLMISIGESCGRNVRALITDMNEPLGYAVGNMLEVKEAAALLKGGKCSQDLYNICISLSAHMISMALGITLEQAEAKAENAVKSNAAYSKFSEWISAQGGYMSYIESEICSHDSKMLEVVSESEGYITSVDAELIGKASVTLGAGRVKKDDKIDPLAGIILYKKQGDKVKKGEKIAAMYASSCDKIAEAEPLVKSAFKTGANNIEQKKVILKTVM